MNRIHRRDVRPARDAERFIEEVRGDDPELASYLRIEERELEAGGGMWGGGTSLSVS
jgi:hypothetical protein